MASQSQRSDDDIYDEIDGYHIDDPALVALLLPGTVGDQFQFLGVVQNELLFCPLLRRHLRRAGYSWDKHPDCRLYNHGHGCQLKLPITIMGWNNANPYPHVWAFLVDYQATSQNVGPAARKDLYHLLNEGIGGPQGKVRVFSQAKISGMGFYFELACTGPSTSPACLCHATAHAPVWCLGRGLRCGCQGGSLFASTHVVDMNRCHSMFCEGLHGGQIACGSMGILPRGRPHQRRALLPEVLGSSRLKSLEVFINHYSPMHPQCTLGAAALRLAAAIPALTV